MKLEEAAGRKRRKPNKTETDKLELIIKLRKAIRYEDVQLPPEIIDAEEAQQDKIEINELIRIATEDIKDNHYNENVTNYGYRLRHSRKLKGFSMEKVASMMDISHAAISKFENDRSKDGQSIPVSVDVQYLEMFSIIYQVSPYYLVGKVDRNNIFVLPKEGPAYGVAMEFPAEDKARIVPFIINMLTKSESDASYRCLEAISRVAKATDKVCTEYCSYLRNNRAMSTLMAHDLNSFLDYKGMTEKLESGERLSEFSNRLFEEHIRYLYRNRACKALASLVNNRDDLLELFAMIAVSDEKTQSEFTLLTEGCNLFDNHKGKRTELQQQIEQFCEDEISHSDEGI